MIPIAAVIVTGGSSLVLGIAYRHGDVAAMLVALAGLLTGVALSVTFIAPAFTSAPTTGLVTVMMAVATGLMFIGVARLHLKPHGSQRSPGTPE